MGTIRVAKSSQHVLPVLEEKVLDFARWVHQVLATGQVEQTKGDAFGVGTPSTIAFHTP